jgi:glycosyltransferase involved in cell wall biosynthesis
VASKGVEHLLEAFAHRPQYRLDVAGEGPLQDSLRRRFSTCPNIRLVGSLQSAELVQMFRRACAVILPSWGPEAGPLAPLEALACGTPAIVRRAGGSAEAVEMSGGGLVYDNPEELLPLVDRIAGDAGLRRALSERAVSASREQFAEQQWMRQYFGIIEQIGRKNAAGRCTGRNHT